MSAPAYPGYKADKCNGCGLCCLVVPCSVSVQYDLWKNGRCRALKNDGRRYWCQAVNNPGSVSVRLAKESKADRIDALGTGQGCDHRAAFTKSEALALLEERNLIDELANNANDTYPRGAIMHAPNGSRWHVFKLAAEEAAMVEPIELGQYPFNNAEPFSSWVPPAEQQIGIVKLGTEQA